jgi:rhamnogalacturonyl hydrolase YesR
LSSGSGKKRNADEVSAYELSAETRLIFSQDFYFGGGHMPIRFRVCGWILAITCAGGSITFAADSKSDSTAAKYGEETLSHIHDGFYMPDRHLYREEVNGKSKNPSWTWDASIQLGALCAAARLDPEKYLPQVREYATALASYRTTFNGKPAFDVNPGPKSSDRYYDDNAWICMSLLEAYELTHDARSLELAKECYAFAIGCEDDQLGGGLYWHEGNTKSKNACTSGPSMLAALQFYRITKDESYLKTAERLYEWERKTLQDTDGLVFDNISVPSGQISKAKLTYNSGTLIRAAVELYQVTSDKAYLDEAERVASAAADRFVRKEDGIIGGWGKLAVKLVEAYAELADVDHNDRWKEIVGKCVSAVREKHNAEGFYALDWDGKPLADKAPARLIDQSAVARAELIAAEHGIEVK